MIGGPGAYASSFSPYPAPDDLAKVGVAAAESRVEVLCSCVLSKIKIGYVGEDTLHPQVKCRNARQLRHVDAPAKARFSRVTNRGEFIFGKVITIQREPYVYSGNAVGKVKCRPPVPRIIRRACCDVAATVSVSKVAQGEWKSRPAEECGKRECKFKIARRLEGKLLA